MTNWNYNMDKAPKDGSHVVVWVRHGADPYVLGDGKLTTYAAHAEDFGRCEDGLQVVLWGGEYRHDDDYIPDWWFVRDRDFEVAANPIAWLDVSEPTL